MHRYLGIMLLVLIPVGQAGAASDRADAAEVVDKVRQAAALIEQRGDNALAVITAPSSGFIWKDTYLFIVDCAADRVVANLAFPERVGGDIKQHTDYAGKRYGRELCATAERGGGWIEYVWLRPGGDTPRRKVSYVTVPDGSRFTIGAGIYDDDKTIDELNRLLEPKVAAREK